MKKIPYGCELQFVGGTVKRVDIYINQDGTVADSKASFVGLREGARYALTGIPASLSGVGDDAFMLAGMWKGSDGTAGVEAATRAGKKTARVNVYARTGIQPSALTRGSRDLLRKAAATL